MGGVPGIRVLIADPDERLLSGYQEVLGGHFELHTARSDLECIARLRELTPDVLVLEPQLPHGGGDAVLAVMHDSLALASVPVMILTSCRERAVLESIAPYRISDYRVKPLSPAQLAKRIHNVLERSGRRDAATEEADRMEHRNVWRVETAAVGF